MAAQVVGNSPTPSMAPIGSLLGGFPFLEPSINE